MVIASMNKGQLPILGVLAIIALVIWRMPETEITPMLKSIGEKMVKFELLSYPLLLVSLTGWFLHARSMRRRFSEEYKRIGREKSELQRQLTSLDLQSSDGA